MTHADERHLDDDRLVAARTGARPLRRGERAHLDTCTACARRDAGWRDALDRTRAAADRAADEVFTPSRLARQRAAILERIGRLEPARVLAFPTATTTTPVRPNRLRTRGVAGAAAAGLLVGVITGRYVSLAPRQPPQQVGTSALARPARVVVTPVRAAVIVTDDEFLSQVDTAIGGPRVPELRAIDDFTPRVRDASIRVR